MILALEHKDSDECLKSTHTFDSAHCKLWRIEAALNNNFHRCCSEHLITLDLGFTPFFGESPCLGHIWAAIQTELLSYRRLTEEDPWTSG